MSAIADTRQVVLDRIRAATRNFERVAGLPEHGDSAQSRDYVWRGSMTAEARLERMAERLREYDAEVVECRPEGLAAAIAAQLAASGRRNFVVPAELPAEWLAPGFDWKIDGNLPVDEIERADGVVTACFCGVAESGTIVLHHGAMEGRRVITLLPDWHLCILRASQVVETLPEYFDRCEKAGNEGPSHPIGQTSPAGEPGRGQGNEREGTGGPGTKGSNTSQQRLPALVTWISGPSATADIEMTRIKGVHGPRLLHVILVRDGARRE
jgi:L-lactate dehydrogenase complex protein LldG